MHFVDMDDFPSRQYGVHSIILRVFDRLVVENSSEPKPFVHQAAQYLCGIIHCRGHVLRVCLGLPYGIWWQQAPLRIGSNRGLVLHIAGEVAMPYRKHPVEVVSSLAWNFLGWIFGNRHGVVCVLQQWWWSRGVPSLRDSAALRSP